MLDGKRQGEDIGMGRYRGRLGVHEGFAAGKLGDGTLVDTRSKGWDTGGVGVVIAYVAACSTPDTVGGPHWFGPDEHPPTDHREKAALDEWQHLHARHLLVTAVAPTQSIARDVTAMLDRLETLVIESPIAMLGELQRVRQRTDTLLALSVAHSRLLGASWTAIAAALGTSVAAAKHRFGGSVSGEASD